MPSKAQVIEERVLKACDAFKRGEFPNMKTAADAFDAPVQRVRRRLRGFPDASSRGGHNKRLSEDEETALCAVVKSFDDLGLPLGPREIAQMANRVLQRAAHEEVPKEVHKAAGGDINTTTNQSQPQPQPCVSSEWTRRFLGRHPELIPKMRKGKPGPSSKEACPYLLSSDTTVKGTGLAS